MMMMVRSLAVVRTLARSRPPTHRRPLSTLPSSVADKIAKLSESERAEASKYLDGRNAEVENKLLGQVDAYLQRTTSSNNVGNFNRVGAGKSSSGGPASLPSFFFPGHLVSGKRARMCARRDKKKEKPQTVLPRRFLEQQRKETVVA